MIPILLPLVLPISLFYGPSLGGPEKVSFETQDHVTIKADFYLERSYAPTVLCLPMYRHTRKTYAALVTPLRRAGFNILVMDLRGHGESAPELAERVQNRDPRVFNSMHLDVEAAIRFLGKRGLDTTRLGLVGASVGCSVALASAVRYPGSFRACVVMTPGANYLGINSLRDARRWHGIPLLILSSEEEAPRVKVVADAFAGPRTAFRIVPGSNRHGTRMFGKVKGIENDIAAFLKKTLGADTVILLPQFDESDPQTKKPGFIRKTLRLTRNLEHTSYTLMTFAKGGQWSLSAMVKGDFHGKVRIQIGGVRYEMALDTKDKPKGKTGPHKGIANVKLKTSGSDSRLRGKAPVVSAASFRGFHWVTLDCPLDPFLKVGSKGISAHFLPKKGKAVDLPSKGRYLPQLRKIPFHGNTEGKSSSRPASSGSKRH